MRCDQCVSLYINGVFTHEHGCPNQGKDFDLETGMWLRTFECFECGERFVEGEEHNCLLEEEEDASEYDDYHGGIR